MDLPTRLFLFRHAEVEERYHRVFGGRIDMALSPKGLTQAEALCNYLHPYQLDSIYASPMKRVQETLGQWRQDPKPPTTIVEGFREIDFGEWTGLNWNQVNERFQVGAHEWLNHLEKGLMSGAESVSDFRQRIQHPLQEILANNSGKRIAVACHGGVIRMALSILLDIPFPKMSGFEFEYAGLTIVHVLPHKNEVQLANYVPWRDQG